MYLRRVTGQCQCLLIFMSLPCSSISADMSASGITADVDWGVAVDRVSVVRDGSTSTSVDSPFESTSSTCPSLHVSPPPRRRRDKTCPFPCATDIAESRLILPPCAGLGIPQHLDTRHNFPSNGNTVGWPRSSLPLCGIRRIASARSEERRVGKE